MRNEQTLTCMPCEAIRMAKVLNWITNPEESCHHTWLTNSIGELSNEEWGYLEVAAAIATRLAQAIQEEHGADL